MWVKLRILFTILSAICAAAVIPVGTLFNLAWALICVVAAIVFFAIMLLFKAQQERAENPPEEQGDYFQPKSVQSPSTKTDEKKE